MLTSLDARLALVEVQHKEFQVLRESLEFSQQQVASLTAQNQSLKDNVKKLTEGMTQLSGENKRIKESILDIQARSMQDILVFSGIPKEAEDFIQHQLKHPSDTVKDISFHRNHRLGGKKPGNHACYQLLLNSKILNRKNNSKEMPRPQRWCWGLPLLVGRHLLSGTGVLLY